MIIPDSMVGSDDLSISTQYTIVYDASNTPVYYMQGYKHSPFNVWLVFWLITSMLFVRFIIEIVKRLNKKNGN